MLAHLPVFYFFTFTECNVGGAAAAVMPKEIEVVVMVAVTPKMVISLYLPVDAEVDAGINPQDAVGVVVAEGEAEPSQGN